MKASDQIKRLALYKAVDALTSNPEKNIPKIMNLIDKAAPDDVFTTQRAAIRRAIDTKDNWYQLIVNAMNCMDPEFRKQFMRTFIVDANLMAWPKQEEMRENYQCNIPWAILLDPTSACNLKCKGCWAADYGHSLQLTYEDIDSIIRQGKELGTYVYIYTGGEPLVRKKDLIRLCEAHPDCAFLCFTNATLIDEEFCQEILRVKNFIPAISAEGSEATTDSRRGDGVYSKIVAAMELLKKHGLPFGISACFTGENAESIASEEYYDWMIEQGALFCWIFTYMPVGSDASEELMPSLEQRLRLYNIVRDMRHKKPLFVLDFQNDGEFVGGCIAGGRRYLHINARGDVEPCVFIHYANVNIHDVSLLDALRSPIFMEYYREQPFNDNYLRPCPMLENPECLPALVERAGAKCTNLTAQESAEELCAKCKKFADNWAPVAESMWNDPEDPEYASRRRENVGMAVTDMTKFERLGRKIQH
jgi:MoaA/NifB/PqqE/SkfB family radical SAM enzyme